MGRRKLDAEQKLVNAIARLQKKLDAIRVVAPKVETPVVPEVK